MVGKQPPKTSSSSRSRLARGANGSGDAGSSGSSGAKGRLPTKRSRSDEAGDTSDRPSKSARAGIAQTTKETTAAITFGIEFEFVLAFHETALDSSKEQGIILDIVKEHGRNKQYDLLDHEHTKGSKAFANRTLWPSWLVKVPGDDQVILKDAVRGTSELAFDGTYVRRYVMEPLLVVREALARAGLTNVQVIG